MGDLSNLADAKEVVKQQIIIVMASPSGKVPTTYPACDEETIFHGHQEYHPVDGQPPMWLVGFKKVYLEAGETTDITITIDPFATNHPLGVWGHNVHDFIIGPGEYKFYVGNASDNTPFTLPLIIQ